MTGQGSLWVVALGHHPKRHGGRLRGAVDHRSCSCFLGVEGLVVTHGALAGVPPDHPPRRGVSDRIPDRFGPIFDRVHHTPAVPGCDGIDDLPIGEHVTVPMKMGGPITRGFGHPGSDDELPRLPPDRPRVAVHADRSRQADHPQTAGPRRSLLSPQHRLGPRPSPPQRPRHPAVLPHPAEQVRSPAVGPTPPQSPRPEGRTVKSRDGVCDVVA